MRTTPSNKPLEPAGTNACRQGQGASGGRSAAS
jgi:hypothetical protein